MLFASLSFGLFTLTAFALYWATDRVAFRNVVIATVSLFLYYWWEPRFLPLLLYFILVNFLLGRLSEMFPSRRFTIVCVLLNLLPLATYKYWNFAKENIQLLVSPAAAWSLEPVILPLGISFFAFQGLGYILDVRSRTVPPCRDLVQFTAFKAFFPLLLAGPIERAPNLLKQFSEARRFDAEDVAVGGRYFLWGFFKKLAVADQLAPLVDSAFSNVSQASPLHLCVATFFFAFQIYFDFSGYSDMAIGVGRMFGFQLRRNFAFPYFSRNIVEFWRRWHISLSGWFRDYVYIPMGGNRGTAQRRALAILITFLVSGLWHGAAWNFVAWGGGRTDSPYWRLPGLGLVPVARRKRPQRRCSPGGPGAKRWASWALSLSLLYSGSCSVPPIFPQPMKFTRRFSIRLNTSHTVIFACTATFPP